MKTLEVLFTIILLLSSISLTFRQRGVTRINLFVIAANYSLLFGTITTIGANWRNDPCLYCFAVINTTGFCEAKKYNCFKEIKHENN